MDPGTAYAVVSAVTWPVLKLGGLGASYIGPLLGFGATGVVKGSLAALAQSSIPNVVAGSLFSGMQAATTTSAVVAGSVVGLPTVTTGAAVVYGAYRLWGYFR